MKEIEIVISIAATALPLLGAIAACIVKLIKSILYGKEERQRRLWAEFAQEAIGYVEVLKGKANGELTGETKKDIAMNRVESACIKNGIRFECDKVSEIIEGIIALTNKVNGRDRNKTGMMAQGVLPTT